MPGIFQLSKPRDLLDKLAREIERMRLAPDDADHAFNFFVTAESLVDWLHPGDPKAQRTLRESDALLMAVSHVASSAKHYDKLYSYHQSIESTHVAGGNPVLVLYSLANFPNHPVSWHLRVHLKGSAAAVFGESVNAIELAGSVLEFWSKRISQP
jgi:hypothetical protein